MVTEVPVPKFINYPAPFWMPDINTSLSDFHTPCGNSEISLNTENPAALSHATTFLLFIFGSSLLIVVKLKNDLPFTLYTFLAPLIDRKGFKVEKLIWDSESSIRGKGLTSRIRVP